VEKVIALLATCFRDQHARVARGALQKSMLVYVLRIVLRAYRVVRAEATHFQGGLHQGMDVPPSLDQAAECTFRIRTARKQQHSIAETVDRIDSLANRTGGIPALKRDGCE